MNSNCITYCKFADEKRFQAYDLSEGLPVGNIIYATMMEDSLENRDKLQRLADLNKEQGLVIQLRVGKRIVFATK